MVERIKTYVEDLDKITNGGFPKGTIAMVTGGPGTGKSILCQEILYKNAEKGLKCLYISFEQKKKHVEKQMKVLGMDPNKIKGPGKMDIISIDLSQGDLIDYFLNEYRKTQHDLVCVDSVASLYINPIPISILLEQNQDISQSVSKPQIKMKASEVQDFNTIQKSLQRSEVRGNQEMKMVDIYDKVIPVPQEEDALKKLEIREIIKPMQEADSTILLINQIIPGEPGYSRDEVSEYLCDSLIKLNYSGVAGGASRTLEIVKMRFTKFTEGVMPLELTKKGIVVKPLEEE